LLINFKSVKRLRKVDVELYVRLVWWCLWLGDVVVYKCVVCGRAFDRLAGLRGHLRVHGDVVWENFTVRIPKVLADEFRGLCRRHNTTTCHLIVGVMKACLRGE